jgi:hypothetical protein
LVLYQQLHNDGAQERVFLEKRLFAWPGVDRFFDDDRHGIEHGSGHGELL